MGLVLCWVVGPSTSLVYNTWLSSFACCIHGTFQPDLKGLLFLEPKMISLPTQKVAMRFSPFNVDPPSKSPWKPFSNPTPSVSLLLLQPWPYWPPGPVISDVPGTHTTGGKGTEGMFWPFPWWWWGWNWTLIEYIGNQNHTKMIGRLPKMTTNTFSVHKIQALIFRRVV